jgi:hypothetical protein
MQQFVVPQFIDVEDKIFGPITTRQFLILMSAGGIIFLAFKFADLVLFAIITFVIGGLALLFSFFKPNGQFFHYFLLNIIQTSRKPKLRIWKKFYPDDELEYLRKLNTGEAEETVVKKKEVQRAHIRNLALVVNTGGYYKGDDDEF